MVQVEQRLTGTILRITSRTQYTSDTEMAAAMDVWHGECRFALDLARKARVVGLIEDFLDELAVSPDVD